jgi:phage terminase small subunit
LRGGGVALNEKQERFVEEYLVDLNATQAAIRAGYSEKTARSIGQRLLTNVDIQKEIQREKKDRSYRTRITQDNVLRELAAIGFARSTDYAHINENGHVVLTPTAWLTEEQRIAIAGVKETQFGVEVKMHDKIRALEMIGKHLGIFDAKSNENSEKQNNLLQAIQASEEITTDDLPEVE